MKRKLLILFFVVLNVQAIKAKDALGYYITNELDTIKVIFDVPFDIALGEPSMLDPQQVEQLVLQQNMRDAAQNQISGS